MEGVPSRKGDAGIVSNGGGVARRSIGGLRLGQESKESADSLEFLDHGDPERVVVERVDPDLDKVPDL
jgi:hypothetical protein